MPLPDPILKEFSIGCAALGQIYGIANNGKTPDSAETKKIFEYASLNNINQFDTASNYGNSERVIGDFWPAGKELKVTSKYSIEHFLDEKILMSSIRQSLKHTKQDNLWCLLIHHPFNLDKSTIWKVRSLLKLSLESGLVARVGFSAYSEEEILLAKDAIPELTVFQISENICDQTKYHSQALLDLSKAGNQFFVRSIFLQGLLLMDPLHLPSKVEAAREVLESLATYSKLHSISLLDACIGYAKSIPWATHLIFGVNSVVQLQNILTAFNGDQDLDFADAPKLDSFLTDPRNWS